MYRVEVETTQGSWAVFHRYSDFREMHVRVSSWAAPAGAKLPPRSSNRENISSQQYYRFLHMRRELLDQYLQTLVVLPRAATDPIILNFLGVAEHLVVRPAPSHLRRRQPRHLLRWAAAR